MKEKAVKKALVLFAATVAATAAMAQTNQVLSRNAVGYVRVDAQSNGFTLVRMPFYSMPATNITGILGTALVGNSVANNADQLLKWNATGQTYVTYFKHSTGQWRKLGELVESPDTLLPGETFWIRNRRATNQFVYLMGEVPDAVTAPNLTVTNYPGFNFISYGYPVTWAVNDTNLFATAVKSTVANNADQVLAWDKVSQAYVTYFAHTAGWRKLGDITTTTNVLQPDEGMWYRRRGSITTNWVQIKPYTWP